MKKGILFFWVAFVFPLMLPSLASAQYGLTGSLTGTVKDGGGLILPGVGVTIKSPALILPELNAVTNHQGIYRFPSLPPGQYEITFALDGMASLIRQEIIITAGQTTTIHATLQQKVLENAITVTGQSPMTDLRSTTQMTTLDKKSLAALPSQRTLDAFFNMAPGVVAESNVNGPMSSAHGSGVRDNSYNIDGVNVSSPLAGTMRIDIGTDIMEEFSVQSGGLSAEFGDTTGTVINVVTKSGGNTLSGSAGFFYSDHHLQSNNTKGTPLEGRSSGYQYLYEPAFTLGGPIIKDKLWFFANVSYSRQAVNVASFPYDEDETVPALNSRWCPYFKLSFQPDPANRIILSYNYSDYVQNNANADAYQTENTTIDWSSPSHVVNLQWTHFFSNDLFMDVKLGYMNAADNLRPKSDEPMYYELSTGQYSGAYYLTDLYKHQRLQFNTNATYSVDNVAGSHTLKWGVEYQATSVHEKATFNRDSVNGMSEIMTYGGVPLYGIWFADFDRKVESKNIFAFFQDEWQPTKRLVLNAGVRLSYQRSIIPPQNESEGSTTFLGYTFSRSVLSSMTPVSLANLAPRLGLVYDITGDGKTLFKASYSRYIAANVQQLTLNSLNPNGLWYYAQLLNSDSTPVEDYYLLAYYPDVVTVGYGGKGIRAPHTDEITVSAERELTADFSLSARYIRKMDRNLLEVVDASQLDIDKLVNTGVLEWTNWSKVYFTDPYDGQEKYYWSQNEILASDKYLINPPGAKRDYKSWEIVLNKRFSHGWSMMASYVWQKSTGLIGTDYSDSTGSSGYYENPNMQINAVGDLSLSRRHQFKLAATAQGPWGVNASAFFRFFTGQRYTRQIVSSDLGVTLSQGYSTIYAETRGSRELPSQAILDLRLEKTCHIQNFTLGVFADCFNLFNSNKATAVQTTSSSSYIVFEQMTAIQDPRLVRLGVRFSF